MNWGTPIRPRNTVGAEVVVVTAIPLPPSMTRAEPSIPAATQVGLRGDERSAAIHPDVAALEDSGEVDGLATGASGLGGEPVGSLDRPDLGATVDDEPSQGEQPDHGDRHEQGDRAAIRRLTGRPPVPQTGARPGDHDRPRNRSIGLVIAAVTMRCPGRPGTEMSANGTAHRTITVTLDGDPTATAKPRVSTELVSGWQVTP